MDGREFRRVLRGFDPDEVFEALEELEHELEKARQALQVSERDYTDLRLNAAKQVEEAGAEAAVVLGHARSEATRIREAAVRESEQIRSDADRESQVKIERAEAMVASLERESAETRENLQREIEKAEARAEEIVRFANQRAEKLKSEAAGILREAEERAQASDNQIRLATLESERREGETRDKADSYARKVYQEADRYAQATERRSRELQQHADQIVRESKRRAEEITVQAVDFSRRVLADAVEQMNQVTQEVGGSMAMVNRMRRSVTEQLERLGSVELPAAADNAALSGVSTFIEVEYQEARETIEALTEDDDSAVLEEDDR